MNCKLNLQLFATQTTGTESLAPEMKTYYDKRLLENAEPNLVLSQFGEKRPIPQGNGKTIEFRRFSGLAPATTALTEGVTPDGNSLTVTAITAVVKQYGDFIETSDLLEMTAIDPIIAESNKLLASQAARTKEILTRNVLVQGTNVIYCSKWSGTTETEITDRDDMDATSTLTVDKVYQAATYLKSQDAPTIDGCYVAVIHPYAAYDLMRSPEWIDIHKYDDAKAIFVGEIGKIGNVRFVDSTLAKIWKDSTCPSDGSTGYLAVFGTLVLGANAFGTTEIEGGGLQMYAKQLGSSGSADPIDQRATVGWKMSHVAKILNDAYMVRIESTSKYSTKAAAN